MLYCIQYSKDFKHVLTRRVLVGMAVSPTIHRRLSVEEAFLASTLHPALSLGLQGVVGALTPGSDADMVTTCGARRA